MTILFGAESFCCPLSQCILLSFLSYLNLFSSPAVLLGWFHHPGAGSLPFSLSLYVRPGDYVAIGLSFSLASPLWTLDPRTYVLESPGHSQSQSQYPLVTRDAWDQPTSKLWGLLALCNTQPQPIEIRVVGELKIVQILSALSWNSIELTVSTYKPTLNQLEQATFISWWVLNSIFTLECIIFYSYKKPYQHNFKVTASFM